MAYALQSMLKIRGMREERAQTELAAARSARAQAQHELEKKIEERQKFEETKEERRDKIFATVMGRVVSMTDLDQVRSAVSGIDEQGMLLEEAEHKAEHVLEEREAETEVARGRFAAASKLREILAKYQEVELLLRIGEYKKGADKATDEAIDKIDAVNAFLCQGLDERPEYGDTIERLKKAVS